MKDGDNIRVIEGGRTPNMTSEAVRQIRANIERLIDELVVAAKDAGASAERDGWGDELVIAIDLEDRLKAEVAKLVDAAT